MSATFSVSYLCVPWFVLACMTVSACIYLYAINNRLAFKIYVYLYTKLFRFVCLLFYMYEMSLSPLHYVDARHLVCSFFFLFFFDTASFESEHKYVIFDTINPAFALDINAYVCSLYTFVVF